MRHNDRHPRSGRYVRTPLCDACNKPVGANHFTDDAVCGNGDGPGFFLCSRKTCRAKRDLPVEQRRALYAETRFARGTRSTIPTHIQEIFDNMPEPIKGVFDK